MVLNESVLPAPKKGVKEFCEVLISEGSYNLTFSNRGEKPKPNVCPKLENKWPMVNGKKMQKETDCVVEGCYNKTRKESGICSAHGDALDHIVDWVGVIDPHGIIPDFNWIIENALGWARGETDRGGSGGFRYLLDTDLPPEATLRVQQIDSLVDRTMNAVVGNVPDATALQRIWDGRETERLDGLTNPKAIAESVLSIVDACFPLGEFEGKTVDAIFQKEGTTIGLDAMPVRVLAGLLSVAFVCEEINRGTQFWARRYSKSGSQLGCVKTFLGAYLPLRYSNLPLGTIIQASRM